MFLGIVVMAVLAVIDYRRLELVGMVIYGLSIARPARPSS